MEHLMRRCIDSLLSQTFTDYELLLIDDGSKDGSWRICQEDAHKDVRISIFHKENGGLSDARNYGLSKALAAGGKEARVENGIVGVARLRD